MTVAPGAAVNEYDYRRIPVPGWIDIQHLVRRGPIGNALRRTETGADKLAFARAASVQLIAVWRIDRLVVGVVELILIHVKPDAGPLRVGCDLLRRSAGRNHCRRGGGTYDGPSAHQISFAAIVVHRTSGAQFYIILAHFHEIARLLHVVAGQA